MDTSVIQTTPSPVSPPRPWQVMCCCCHVVLSVTPPPGATAFSCPSCRVEQFLPPELLPNPQPSLLNLKSAPPDRAANQFNSKVQVGCCNCMATLKVPRGLTRFKCPLCQVDLAFSTSSANPTLPVKEVSQKINTSLLESNTASTSPTEEQQRPKIQKINKTLSEGATASTPPIEQQSPKSLKRAREIKEEGEDNSAVSEFDLYFPFYSSCHSELWPDQVKADPDIAITAEKDLVASRDFPHSRHLCAKYPFQQTPHHIYCNTCYCCLCDSPAPCKEWTVGSIYIKHCDATAVDITTWRSLMKNQKKRISYQH